MKLAVITNAPIVVKNDENYLYAPYLKELNLWGKHVDSIIFCCPLWNNNTTLLVSKIETEDFIYSINEISDFNISSIKDIVRTFILLPNILWRIYKTMKSADHIHLRCPGNVGLLACLVQILFPNKTKTAKYAGNWDPNAKQPLSYKLQKWILNNPFLTKNMQVLVYGEWEGMSKNILPFFTATYSDNEAIYANSLPDKNIPNQAIEPMRFMYVGTLSPGKRPLYALQLFQYILKQFPNSTLDVYGEGMMRQEVEVFITENRLQNNVILHGNQAKEIVEKAYQNNHFLILASQSEGWPKVVAEAMFWGCVPLSTHVSCVYQMMGQGSRGVLLEIDLQQDTSKVINLINNPIVYSQMSKLAKKWSTQYTVDKFEKEIKKLIV